MLQTDKGGADIFNVTFPAEEDDDDDEGLRSPSCRAGAKEAAHTQVLQPGAGAHILAVPALQPPLPILELDVPSSYSSPAAWPPLLHLIVANEVEK